MSSSGLSETDLADHRILGGIAKEYYNTSVYSESATT